MGSFYDDNEDLQFYVRRGIDWEPLVRAIEHDFQREDGFGSTDEAVEFYEEVLGLVGAFAADALAPQALALDRCHPTVVDGEVQTPPEMQEAIAALTDLELGGLTLPREIGGLNAPLLVFHLTFGLLARADVSVCAHYGFQGGIAAAALAFSEREGTTVFDPALPGIKSTRFQAAIDSILSGEEWGSMDITEPDAGSDMAALTCRGEVDEDGHWTLTGTKIFITSGHGRWHFVIARTEGPEEPGLAGLSMFLVEAFTRDEDGRPVRTHTSIDGVEEKLGHNGSATVSIRFDGAPAQLIGARGAGFGYMLQLMNGARVGVGFEALGMCEAALRLARSYAQQRPSMGKTIDRHEMIADYLDEMQTDIQGIRALAMRAGYDDELSKLLKRTLRTLPPQDPEELAALESKQRRLARSARRLTPLLKYLAAEKAVEIARRGIQIHGGAGYIVESGAEKLLRDAMVLPIYEGTSQIQALMAMKDTLMAHVSSPRRFVREVAQTRLRSVSSRDPLLRRVARLKSTEHQAIQFLLSRLAGHKLRALRNEPLSSWATALTDFDPKRDFSLAMLHAERLCVILSDVAVAEELLAQATAHTERAEVLERWLERAEPRCRAQLDRIQTTGARLLHSLHDQGDIPPVAQAAK